MNIPIPKNSWNEEKKKKKRYFSSIQREEYNKVLGYFNFILFPLSTRLDL